MYFKHKIKPFTHTGRLSNGKLIILREITKYWITENGMRYSKKTGRMDNGFGAFELDLNSVMLKHD